MGYRQWRTLKLRRLATQLVYRTAGFSVLDLDPLLWLRSDRAIVDGAVQFVSLNKSWLQRTGTALVNAENDSWVLGFWIKPDSVTGVTSSILSWGATTGFLAVQSNASVQAYVGSASPVSVAGLVAGQWAFVAIAYDRILDTSYISLNGGAWTASTAGQPTITATSETLAIGARAGGVQPYDGCVDSTTF